MEGLEQLGLVVFGDVDVGIVDLNFDLYLGIIDGLLFYQYVDIVVFGKFDGVVYEVGYNLLQMQWVVDNVVWYIVFNIQCQFQFFIVCGMCQQGDYFIK